MEGGKGVGEKKGAKDHTSYNNEIRDLNLELTELQSLRVSDSAAPEIPRMSHTPPQGKPPKIPTEPASLRAPLSRSAFSKPKPVVPGEQKVTNEIPHLKSAPITPRTPLIDGGEEDDDEEVYKTAKLKVREKSGKKMKKLALIELIAFVCIVMYWGLELWKWCVLVLVVLCGSLVTEGFINVLVFVIEFNFLLKKNVLYFVYGLKRSVQIFIWLGLVLLAWSLLKTCRILGYVAQGLASCLIGAAIWLVKNLSVKVVASSFQCNRFFDRIQESIFHHYVLRTFSGPPLMEMAERVGRIPSSGQLSFKRLKGGKKEGKEGAKEEVIDVEKPKKMNRKKISAWTLKVLVNVVRSSGLSTISNTLESLDDEESEQKGKEITSEWEANAAAYDIFLNVTKRINKYIEEDDLLRFMKKEEVDIVLPLFDGVAETGKIKRKALKNLLVNVYLERKSLARSLNDTKTAIEKLNRLASGVLLLVIITILLVVFVFGNTAKTVFEAIIFVFVMHPFDVGDRCVLIVEEMNILTTVFLRSDNEKVFYPNSRTEYFRYLDSKTQHWRPGHSVVVKDTEDVNKMKMAPYVTHTINFQNYGDKTNRRSDLVLELKKILEDLGIKYHLLPQEVHLRYVGSSTAELPPTWL
ncbi:unnamed protein product [Malus baccata var. baccata]